MGIWMLNICFPFLFLLSLVSVGWVTPSRLCGEKVISSNHLQLWKPKELGHPLPTTAKPEGAV